MLGQRTPKKIKSENIDTQEINPEESEKKETLALVEETKDESSNGALILDTLAEEEQNKTEEEKSQLFLRTS